MVRRRLSAARTAWVSLVAIVIVVVSSILARGGSVPAWEESILLFFNDWPDWFEPLMWVLQQVGVTGAPIVAAVVVYYYTRRWQHLVAFAAILPLKLVIEKGIVKQLIERNRPFESVGDHINVRGPAFEGLSYPSGHTTTAFAVGIVLSAFLPPKWRALPVAWATIVGIARLYYGEHNVLDVVTGAATGTFFGVVLWYLLLNRFADEDGQQAAVPGS